MPWRLYLYQESYLHPGGKHCPLVGSLYTNAYNFADDDFFANGLRAFMKARLRTTQKAIAKDK